MARLCILSPGTWESDLFAALVMQEYADRTPQLEPLRQYYAKRVARLIDSIDQAWMDPARIDQLRQAARDRADELLGSPGTD